MATQFRQLNDGWNAEPNAADPTVQVDGAAVVFTFLANPSSHASPRISVFISDSPCPQVSPRFDEGRGLVSGAVPLQVDATTLIWTKE